MLISHDISMISGIMLIMCDRLQYIMLILLGRVSCSYRMILDIMLILLGQYEASMLYEDMISGIMLILSGSMKLVWLYEDRHGVCACVHTRFIPTLHTTISEDSS